MRTTITLDEDVERLLRRAIRERDISFKDAVNEAIRSGLRVYEAPHKVFRQKTVTLGAERHFSLEKALTTAATLEDEELMRKIALRK